MSKSKGPISPVSSLNVPNHNSFSMLQIVDIVALIDRVIWPNKLTKSIHSTFLPKAIIDFTISPCVLSFTMHMISQKFARILFQENFAMLSLNCQMEIEEKRLFYFKLNWMWVVFQSFFNLFLLLFSFLQFLFNFILYTFSVLLHFLFELLVIFFSRVPFLHRPVEYLSPSSIPKVILKIAFILCLFGYFFPFSMFIPLFPQSNIFVFFLYILQSSLPMKDPFMKGTSQFYVLTNNHSLPIQFNRNAFQFGSRFSETIRIFVHQLVDFIMRNFAFVFFYFRSLLNLIHNLRLGGRIFESKSFKHSLRNTILFVQFSNPIRDIITKFIHKCPLTQVKCILFRQIVWIRQLIFQDLWPIHLYLFPPSLPLLPRYFKYLILHFFPLLQTFHI